MPGGLAHGWKTLGAGGWGSNKLLSTPDLSFPTNKLRPTPLLPQEGGWAGDWEGGRVPCSAPSRVIRGLVPWGWLRGRGAEAGAHAGILLVQALVVLLQDVGGIANLLPDAQGLRGAKSWLERLVLLTGSGGRPGPYAEGDRSQGCLSPYCLSRSLAGSQDAGISWLCSPLLPLPPRS